MIVMNFLTKPVLVHKYMCVAMGKGKLETLLVAKQEREPKLTADVNVVL